MKLKTLLLFTLSFLCFSVYAQHTGGVKGKIVSRNGRVALEGVKVTLTPGNLTTNSDETGYFEFALLEKGEYFLNFETDDFEPLQLGVRVESLVRDINVVLVPLNTAEAMIDDAIFAEFDTEGLTGDAQSLPSSLSASKDLFTNIASYKFSEMRFNPRGYSSEYQDVYVNGIRLNDAMTGYTPWSLWSGLNDATRNQENTTGLKMAEVGIGGIAGVTNINMRASQLRKGFRASLVNANSMYRFRGMLTYSSGRMDNGWAYSISLSTRQGGNDYVNGVYYNTFGYFLAVEKEFNSKHRLALSILGTPTERGAQQASTQEVYDLVGNNYYNPNWGWWKGEKRNARVRNNHEPVAILSYTYDINDRTQLNLASSFRFGKNGYSALNWHAGPDPRPDYYRYLPSYYKENTIGANLYEAWMNNTDNIRHINWDKLYQINRMQYNENGIAGYRAMNMVEERHTDQLDFNFAAQFSHLFQNNSKIMGGANFRKNRTEYYTKVKSLIGADYWIDIDKYAERDMGLNNPLLIQNDVDYYQLHGSPRIVREGDKFGYDYYANLMNARAWLQYGVNFGGLSINLGAEGGYNTFWRDGIWKKGMFVDNSQGESEKQEYLTYKGKANFRYLLSGAHVFEANALYMQNAPSFQSAFVSARTRNTATPGIKEEKVMAFDASYNFRKGDFKGRLTGFYTNIKDQSKVISYYDDVEGVFSNFAMSGIEKLHFGLEAAISIPIYGGLSYNSAVSYGQYTYNNNPYYVQIQDNIDEVINSGKVYWKNFRVENTPQLAVNFGLNYRGKNNLYASVDYNYYNYTYISMSPLNRTDAVLTPGLSTEDIIKLRHQEKYKPGGVLNASIGKNWFINRLYTLGFSLEVKNILNKQDLKTGGYDQIRLRRNTDDVYMKYEQFYSKYFYMFGTSYYLNLYLRF